MDESRYIWCRNCGAVHHVSPFDRSPVYTIRAGEVEETPTDDWRAFMARHAGHRLEPLKSTGNSYFPEGSPFDPMSSAYMQVSNDEETLLLRRKRSSIEEPVAYEIVKGRIVESDPNLEIQERAIRKEMKLHFSWAPAAALSDDKITVFLGFFQAIVDRLDAHALNPTEYSYSDDSVSYCQIDSGVIDALMEKCRDCFLPAEVAALRRFVEAHCGASDVMALVKRSRATIVPD